MVEKQSSLVCEQPHCEIQMDLLFVVTEPLFFQLYRLDCFMQWSQIGSQVAVTGVVK